jgi:TRAP-type C4-dicarboxylate transport system substrate-binding protein
MKHMSTGRRFCVLVSVTLATTLSACGSAAPASVDKVGGHGEPVVLRMGDVNALPRQVPAIEQFSKRVHELSAGALQVEVTHNVGGYAHDAEAQLLRAVADGSWDLGSVGTSMLDTFDVSTFAALTAPMLIDSYALEETVIKSDIPGQMLGSLEPLGVTGLAILGDGLRRPIGIDKPIVTRDDWRGIGFGTWPSAKQSAAIEALAATPGPGFGAARDEAIEAGRIQGFELDLNRYHDYLAERTAPYITANVILWPRTLVLFVNPDRLGRLTAVQHGWLEQAAADTAASSTGLLADETNVVRDICLTGGRFAEASESDLVALRSAFGPVYIALERDAPTKAFIERILELKSATAAAATGVVVPADCSGVAPGQPGETGGAAPKYLNGIYRWTLTGEDVLASPTEDKSAGHLATFPWVLTMTLQDGTWSFTHTEAGQPMTDASHDKFSVAGDRISFHWPEGGGPGYTITFTFSVDDQGGLHLRPVPPMNPGEVFVWTTHPWTKID